MNITNKGLRLINFLIFLMILIIILIIALLNIPSKSIRVEDNKVTKLYYADNISSAHKTIIDLFNKEYNGEIEVIPVNLPFTKFSTNERKELLARTLRSKSGRIDLFTVDIIWVPRFAKWCQPLEKYFPEQWREGIVPHVIESCYYNDQLVAMPLYTDIGLMYYRKDLIAKLPNSNKIIKKLKESISWEEFIDLQSEFIKNGINNPFYVFPADNYEGLICSFYEGFARKSSDLFYSNPIYLQDTHVKKSLNLLVNLVNKYQISPVQITKFDEFQGYLFSLDKDVIFVRGWPGFLEHYKNIVPDTSKLNKLEKVALPHFKGTQPAFVYGGWNFMISQFSNKKNEAVEFIKFCLRQKNQKILFEKGGYLPIMNSVYKDSAYVAKYYDLSYYYELLKNGVHRPYLEDYTKISDVLSYYAHLAIKNEIPTEEALQEATELINSKQVLIK